MRHLISQAVRTSTFRQTVITTVSTFTAAGLGAVFYLLLARLMSQADYGLFTLSASAAMLAIGLADLGSGQSLIRFVGQNRDSAKYYPFALIALRLKILAGAVCLVVFLLFARPLATLLLNQPALASLLPAAGLLAASMLLLTFPADLARGLQRFALWGGVQVGANVLRLALLGLLFVTTSVTPGRSLLVFALSVLVAFFISWAWLDHRLLKTKILPDHVSHFWSFNKWTAAFIIASAVTSRLDTFVSARYLSLDQLGVYGLAGTMAAFMPQLSGALGAVTSAKFASFTDAVHATRYLKKAVLFNSAVSLAVAAAMVPAAFAVVWFTGRGYSASLPPFFILLIALVLFTSLNPLRDSVFYFHARPDLFFWISLAQSAVVITVGAWLIPALGVIGSALTVLISIIFLSLAMLYFYLRLAHRPKP